MIDLDTKYMARALELAQHGRGSTSPNPMVGAVIVGADGRIIGEGYHRRCGEGHAEVNAVASVADRSLLGEATIYVTLEPCSHYGKTPPCAKLIIDSGIRKVVVGAADPFKEVAGRGVAMLRAAGIEVVEGVLEQECRSLNARFMTAHEQQRPWITLKWAQSADGWMDNDHPDGQAYRFSTPVTSAIVHRLRSLHDAIGVGSGTVLADNPRLDCRHWCGRSPQPVVFDRRGRIDAASTSMSIIPLIMSDYTSISDSLKQLYAKGITSLMVEGGSQLLHAFVAEGLWDVAQVETAPVSFGERGRAKAPTLGLTPLKSIDFSPNRIDIYSRNPLFSVKNL